MKGAIRNALILYIAYKGLRTIQKSLVYQLLIKRLLTSKACAIYACLLIMASSKEIVNYLKNDFLKILFAFIDKYLENNHHHKSVWNQDEDETQKQQEHVTNKQKRMCKKSKQQELQVHKDSFKREQINSDDKISMKLQQHGLVSSFLLKKKISLSVSPSNRICGMIDQKSNQGSELSLTTQQTIQLTASQINFTTESEKPKLSQRAMRYQLSKLQQSDNQRSQQRRLSVQHERLENHPRLSIILEEVDVC